MPRTNLTKFVATALAVASLGFAGMGQALADDEMQPAQVDQGQAAQVDPGEVTGARIVTIGLG